MIRIGTLNVHSWCDAGGRGRTADTIELLRELACDLVFLNEVTSPEGTLLRVADALDYQAVYGEATFAGNAILSRAPLEDVRNLPLPAKDSETRSAVLARVTLDGLTFAVACTHLDHRREAARTQQLEKLLGVLRSDDPLHVVGGDFNALRLSDYSGDGLDIIRRHRAESHWEPPMGEVVARMDALGYVDAARLADAGSRDAYAASLARPIAPSLRATCWAGTRVDQVWLAPALAARLSVVEARVVDANVSDHRPFVVTLARRP